jgi:hypothetical protein
MRPTCKFRQIYEWHVDMNTRFLTSAQAHLSPHIFMTSGIVQKRFWFFFFLLHARLYANAERRQVARVPEGVHRVRVQNKQLKRRLRAIVSCVDGQCGSRTSRARRIDSGGAEMFNNSFQGLF